MSRGLSDTRRLTLTTMIILTSILSTYTITLYNGNINMITILVECRRSGNQLIIAIPYKLNDSIILSFIHSVHKTPQIEILKANNKGFYLEEVRFKEYGAGVPVSPEELGGGVMIETRGFIVYRSINEYLGKEIMLDLKNAMNMSVRIDGLIITDKLCDFVKITTAA
ncbi:MAG: DUF1850 domain-containing protein [Desulfurococcales archaeon]|nr:DUF1850 domain-containing protein [Desulfurococcales archaeon]